MVDKQNPACKIFKYKQLLAAALLKGPAAFGGYKCMDERKTGMGLIVQKFGGTSVADAAAAHVAEIITDTYKAGNQVVAVLSAQGDTTDDLIEKAMK